MFDQYAEYGIDLNDIEATDVDQEFQMDMDDMNELQN